MPAAASPPCQCSRCASRNRRCWLSLRAPAADRQTQAAALPALLEVRGEVLMPRAGFEQLNARQLAAAARGCLYGRIGTCTQRFGSLRAPFCVSAPARCARDAVARDRVQSAAIFGKRLACAFFEC